MTPGPVIHPDNREFWEAIAHGALHLQRCAACGTLRYPVSPICHECLSERHAWEPMSGAGTLVTAVTVQRATGDQDFAALVPYSVALVRLDEGPRLKGFIAAPLQPGTRVMAGCQDSRLWFRAL